MPLRIIFLLSIFVQTAFAQPSITLIKNINPLAGGTASSNPILIGSAFPYMSSIEYKSRYYFTADDGVHGREFFSTDGTANGTALLKDIHPGSGSSTDGYNYSVMFVVNDILVFVADDGVHGPEFWRTDGTETGTTLLKDLSPTSGAPSAILIGDNVFIQVIDQPQNQVILYTTDGTTQGTVPFRTFDSFHYKGTLNGVVFYTRMTAATGAAASHSLWRTDGTDAGTYALLENVPGSFDINYHAVHWLGTYNGKAYFGNGNTMQLLRTDGTPEGTEVFATLQEPHAYFFGISDVIGDKLFFCTLDYFSNSVPYGALHVTDGTEVGTVELQTFAGGLPAEFMDFNSVNLFFVDYGNTVAPPFDKELWRSDGTPEGTFIVQHMGNYVNDFMKSDHVMFGDKILFESKDTEHGKELWITDGTSLGTTLFADLLPGPESSEINQIVKTVNGIYLTARDESGDFQLWRFAEDCEPFRFPVDGSMDEFVVMNDRLILTGSSPNTGRELFSYRFTDATSCLVTSPDHPDAETHIVHYPNPVHGDSFVIKAAAAFQWKLYNNAGTLVMSGASISNEATLERHDLRSGLYVVHVQTGMESRFLRVLFL